MQNKRGFSVALVIVFIFVAFFAIVFLGSLYWGLEITQTTLGNVTGLAIGNVSFSEQYQNTLGTGLNTLINSLNMMASGLLIGMFMVMVFVSYRFGEKKRVILILDVMIIIIAFVVSVYISQTFETFINSNPTFLDIYSVDFQKPSTLILNLPFIVPIFGALIMLVTYATKRRKEQIVSEYG